MLDWQVELGADEVLAEEAANAYTLPEALDPLPGIPPARRVAPPRPAQPDTPRGVDTPAASPADPVAEAQALADTAADLGALAAAMQAFPHAEIRHGARNFVFADGRPGAHVMIVGEAPGREEDIEGRPFVGRAGQLLDRMFAPVGLGRDAQAAEDALYIANLLPWRPPQNREPSREEIAMFLPFLRRHIALAAPRVLVLMGNTPCSALLGRTGITRMRGQWTEVAGMPALPTFHPAYLLRFAAAKRDAWADLLALRAWLNQ